MEHTCVVVLHCMVSQCVPFSVVSNVFIFMIHAKWREGGEVEGRWREGCKTEGMIS